MKKYTVTITKQLTEEDITDLIVDGLEGGIGYWACLNNTTEVFEKYYKENPELATSEIVAKIILDGGSVRIEDGYDDVEPKYDLTLDRLLKGIEINAKERPWDSDLDNYDADTCDAIIQYAVFDELVFG